MEAGQTLDHQSRPGIRQGKKQRDRLIRLAAIHPEWVLGFGDEVWWSRLAQPAMHTWTPGERVLRLVEKALTNEDPEPKALTCYGLLLRKRSRSRHAQYLPAETYVA
jgi:hypothetical protein